MNKVAVGIIGLSLLILIGGVVIVSSQQSSPRIDTATLSEELAISAADWSKGPDDAKATLVEYSDFQCPACASYFPLLKRAADDFKDDLRLIYRHYPIRQAHKNAELAAQAAEAAGRQGKFWEYHDRLFDFQTLWSEEGDAKALFNQYALDLGLDGGRFLADLESSEVKDKVTGDYQSGLRLGVNATPTFFLNGTRIQNPASYESLKSLIQSAIEQQGS